MNYVYYIYLTPSFLNRQVAKVGYTTDLDSRMKAIQIEYGCNDIIIKHQRQVNSIYDESGIHQLLSVTGLSIQYNNKKELYEINDNIIISIIDAWQCSNIQSFMNYDRTNYQHILKRLYESNESTPDDYAALFINRMYDRIIISDDGRYIVDENNCYIQDVKVKRNPIDHTRRFIYNNIQSILKQSFDDYLNIPRDHPINLVFAQCKLKQMMNYCIQPSICNKIKEHIDCSVQYIPNLSDRLNSNPFLFAFKNKVIDLHNQQVRDIKPSDYISVSTGYEYEEPNPNEINELYGILNQLANPDELKYVLKVLSTGLMGSNTGNTYFFVRANELINLTKASLGNYCSTVKINDLIKQTSQPIYNRMIFSELDIDLNGDQINIMNSNSTQSDIVFQSDRMPVFNNVNSDMINRMRVIQFDKLSVTKKENCRQFANELANNKLNINKYKITFIHILIQHFTYYLNEGLDVVPNKFKKLINELSEDDPVVLWFDARVIRTNNNSKVQSSVLYNDYVKYTQEFNSDSILTQTAFSLLMINKYNLVKSRNEKGVYFKNIEIRDDN